jgi:hypothetical protein
LQLERLLPRQHIIDSARQFVSEHGEGFGLAVFVFEFGKIRFAGLILPSEEKRRCGKGPAQMDVADLLAPGALPFVVRFLGALDQPTIRHEILHARKARDVLNLVEETQGQNRSDAWHRLQAGKGWAIVPFGRARNIECPFPQEVGIVSDVGHIPFNGFPHAAVGEMLLDALAVGLVRQLLANLRQIVLTVRILDVG